MFFCRGRKETPLSRNEKGIRSRVRFLGKGGGGGERVRSQYIFIKFIANYDNGKVCLVAIAANGRSVCKAKGSYVPKAEMDRPGKRTLRNDKTPRASKLAKGEKYTDQGQNTTRSIIANGLLHHLA